MTRRGQGRAPHESGDAPPAGPMIDLDDAGSTPILQQYRAVKAEHPDALVLARLGDFYEMFGADAQEAAPILGVALTGRGFGAAGRLPMCGVPHHAAPAYIRRLLEAGRRVALWDQVGEVVAGRLVRREVTRVLSAGTVSEADYLDETRVARCVALHPGGGRTGIAAFDPASGELLVTEVAGGLDSRRAPRGVRTPRRCRGAARRRRLAAAPGSSPGCPAPSCPPPSSTPRGRASDSSR